LSSRSADVRQDATQVLKRRDPRDFAPFLVGLLRDPIKYEVKKVGGPGSQGELLVKDKEANVKRLYTPLDMPNVPIIPGDRMAFDANGLPVTLRPYAQYSVPVNPAVAANLMFGIGGPAAPSPLANVLHKAGLPSGQSHAVGAQMAHNQNSSRQAIIS